MDGDDRTLIQDVDRTLLMPRPGGQATVVMPRRPPAAAARRPRSGNELHRLVAGINPLLGAAGRLLALVAQLRATTAHADPAALRRQLLGHVAEFEALAADHGEPRTKITAARYVLCCFLDETIAATPWGGDSVWAERNLLQEFHDERDGGAKAFELLERLGEDPATNADLLELFYVCLALGFEGRFRGVPNGRAQLDAIVARVLEVVRPASAGTARTLSVRWQGVALPRAGRIAMPSSWVVVTVAAALMLAIVLLLNARLDTIASPAFRQLHAVPAALQLERAAAASRPRIAPLLREDIAAGSLGVRDEAARSVVTLPADSLFVAGSARIVPARQALLGRVARALGGMPGEIAVVGHTDGAAAASLQYPSNWHLSRERAVSVMAALAAQGAQAQRLRAEGRADAEPVMPDTSAAARAANRRIEIELRLPRPEQAE